MKTNEHTDNYLLVHYLIMRRVLRLRRMRTLSRVYMPSLPLLARLLGRAFEQMAEGNIPEDLIAFH